MYPCHIFGIADAAKAYEEFQGEMVRDYGENVCRPDGSVLHWNYMWDDGRRYLVRCKKCGGLLMMQDSEYHSMSDSPDGYYSDWLPVASEEEGDLLNILLDVMEFENYPCSHLRENNGSFFWTGGKGPRSNDPEDLKRKIRERYGLGT